MLTRIIYPNRKPAIVKTIIAQVKWLKKHRQTDNGKSIEKR